MANDIKEPLTGRHASLFGAIFAGIGCIIFAMQHNGKMLALGLVLMLFNIYNFTNNGNNEGE
jgi:hypothetical protein